MLYFQSCFDILKTRITELEMYPSTSTAVEIPKVKDIKFTRFELSITSVEKYRKERTKDLLDLKRDIPPKINETEEIKIADFLLDNQIKRFIIIKQEDEAREKIKLRMEKEIDRDITPIETLGKLPDIEFLERDYYMLESQYDFQIKERRFKEDQFMSDFLKYIEFHDIALAQYKSDTSEMYVQAATQITAQHHKEIEMKEKELTEFEKQTQEFEKKRTKRTRTFKRT